MITKGQVQAIVLAAGKSKRFLSKSSKLLAPFCGKPLILYTLDILQKCTVPTTFVIGHEKENIKKIVEQHYAKSTFIEQKEQLGTGHALLQTEQLWHASSILVLNGDMPLITSDLIMQVIQQHQKLKSGVTFVTAYCPDENHSYGRVIEELRNIKIIEAKDFVLPNKHQYPINAGIYIFNTDILRTVIKKLNAHNANKEYYITDLIELIQKDGFSAHTINTDFDTIRGINTLEELIAAEEIKRNQLITHWMRKGVRFSLPHTIYLDDTVEIGAGTFVGSGAHIVNKSIIDTDCTIGPFSIIKNSKLGKEVTVHPHSIIEDSIIEKKASIGPFATIHKTTTIKEHAEVGNFVEMVRTTFEKNSKAKHLSYIGDATVGQSVNIGAGTITCNYNGYTKEKTIIHDNSFIGSHTTFIAPVEIGKESFTAAGSIITESVPEQTLAIARTPQINKIGYVPKLKQRYKKTEKNNDPKNDSSQDSVPVKKFVPKTA